MTDHEDGPGPDTRTDPPVDDGLFLDDTPQPDEPEDDGVLDGDEVMTLVEHLTELRTRLLVALGAIGLVACFTLYHSKTITKWIVMTAPQGDGGVSFQVLSPTEAIFIQLKVGLLSALLLSFPVAASQAWAFVRPGLTPSERRLVVTFLPLSSVCFVLGAGFAYFVVIPIGIRFLITFAQGLAVIQYTLEAYTSFVLFFLLIFGLIFQTPFVLIILAKIGILTSDQLVSMRRPIIVGIFVAAAVITPTTDLVVQCLMAGPAWFLFEITIVVMRAMKL